MSEAFDNAREVFPVTFDGVKNVRPLKDLRPMPVRSDDIHISELSSPKALIAPGTVLDLTDLVPVNETKTSAPAEPSGETTNPQDDQDLTSSLDPQQSSSATTSTSAGSPELPVTPMPSQPTATTPTSSSQTRTSTPVATAPSSTTASPAKSAKTAGSTSS